MGESKNDPLRLDFDRQLKLEFHSSTVASDAGLLAYRELDDALALTCPAATGLHDTRTGQNTRHTLIALLRQSIYSRLAGYEDANVASGEVSQDRRKGGVARQIPGVPTGGGGSAPPAIRGHRGTDRPAAAGVRFGVKLAVMDKNGSQVVAVRDKCGRDDVPRPTPRQKTGFPRRVLGPCSVIYRRMGKGEASRAVGGGSDGMCRGKVFLGKSLQSHLRRVYHPFASKPSPR